METTQEAPMIDVKQLADGRWLVCDPRSGHIFMALPASTSDDEVLRVAADIQGGWRPKGRGV
jgi:hypothetical protein